MVGVEVGAAVGVTEGIVVEGERVVGVTLGLDVGEPGATQLPEHTSTSVFVHYSIIISN